jgi:proteasome-associated ATPase
VIVSFAPVNGRTKEFKSRYRIGLPGFDDGACDLELDQAETENVAVIMIGGQLMEVSIGDLKVSPGDILKLEKETLNVFGVEPAIPSGNLVFINQVIDKDWVSVDTQGGQRTVSVGKFSGQLEVNGRVVLDSSLSVIIKNYGLEDGMFAVGETERLVDWDDICGQEKAKQELREAVEGLTIHARHYAYYGKKAVKGMLLYGPPGCSKTMFCKAVYASVVKSCQKEGINPSQGFILVKGPELLNKYVGVGEAYIRHIYAKAKKFKQKYGRPAVVCIDECEAVLANRESGISSDVLRTMVPAILAEMDGVSESGAITLLLTNKPELLDYAVVREGRVDKKIYIGRPDKAAARQIFLLNMRKAPVIGSTQEQLADIVSEELFSPKLVIYKIKRNSGEEMLFTLADIVSGAMVPAIVEEAKNAALKRDLANEVPSGGVTAEDVMAAVNSMYLQNFAFDHAEALRDFTKDFADQVTSIEKQKQVKS